jgi:NADH:ubiquinone oxidoreductase subunit 6 (subunit J)
MPNPPSNPSLVKIFLDGGFLMVPFLLVLILWLVVSIRYATRTRDQRTPRWRVGLLLFPIAFGLLAVSQWVLQWHTIYRAMEVSGFPDEWQHIQDVLVVTRSTLMIAIAACVSLLTTAGISALPSQEK